MTQLTDSTKAYAAYGQTSPLAPFSFDSREPGPRDVQVEILYCGVCHSDLHTARNEWRNTIYPCVPGHEIVGRVVKTGNAATGFKEGDQVAVGVMVDSCHSCPNCRDGYEQYCDHGPVYTYNSPDKHTGGITYGGYSDHIVVDEAFVFRVAESLNPAATAPLLCAGITTYSPLRHWQVSPGQKVGVVGLGGLGHMGLKFAAAFGAEVVLFTTSSNKTADGLRLGAQEVVVSKDQDAMKKHVNSFDFILDTVSADHDVPAYLDLLKRDGTLAFVGLPPNPLSFLAASVVAKRRSIVGSSIGSVKETQEMLDFCAQHNVVSDIEMISIQQVNEAYERMLRSDVKYRFVIDMASLK
jgi:alcohol dehydrogenase (NADP+)